MLEEGLRKGARDMRDEMNVLIWKIERSRDISQEGMKGIVRKGFEAMAGAMEKAMNGVPSIRVTSSGFDTNRLFSLQII